MAESRTVRVQPTKTFFVEMLTRDISIADCILDLIDNSVSKAVTNRGVDVTDYYIEGSVDRRLNSSVEVQFDTKHLRVWDDAGGISVKEAEDDVFRLGTEADGKAAGGLSVYGIGMKRAVFKLGRSLHMRSSTSDEEFVVDWDVTSWMKEPEWKDLPFTKQGDLRARSRRGTTEIVIGDLLQSARDHLGHVSFRRELERRVQTTYGLFLKAGLSLSLNGVALRHELPKIVSGRESSPARKRLRYDGVDMVITAGVTPQQDRQPRGWYVLCNGRVVLEADKSLTTGWGDDMPLFRPKYNHFAGVVAFRSSDPRRLPWTTTKQGVERESPIYQRALAEMKVQARPILNFLNSMYPDEAKATDAAIERAALPDAKAVTVDKVKPRDAVFRAPRARTSANISIQYSRPRKTVQKIKDHLDKPNWSATKVGEHTFDYFVEHELP